MINLSPHLTRLQNGTTVALFIVLALSTMIAYCQTPGAESPSDAKAIRAKEYYDPAMYFDKIWETINDEFWDPSFNNVNWKDIGRRYRSRALAAANHESFALIINQMLGTLRTSHTRYLTKWEPDYYTLQAVSASSNLAYLSSLQASVLEQRVLDLRRSQGGPHRTGIGVITKNIDSRHYVTAVVSSSPGKEAGIVLGDWLVEVDDRPFHPIRSFSGKAGQEVKLVIQGGPSRETRRSARVIPVDKNERELFESDSKVSRKIIKHKGSEFAYARLWWLSGLAMRQVFESTLNMAERAEGIIIDLRGGFGGGPYVEYIDPFLRTGPDPVVVESIYRDHTEKSTIGFNKPVIVLIDGGSRSGKELLAYCFKKWGKAVLLGERTAGYVTGGNIKQISRDSFLYYGACMKLVDGRRLEGVGVEPDIEVPFDLPFARGRDVQLERAKDEVVKLIQGSH